MKFYEVAPVVSKTGHSYHVAFVLMNGNTYNKLTDIQKYIIDKAAREATLAEREADYQSLVSDKETLLKLGTKIGEVDKEAFMKTVEPVKQKYIKKLGLVDFYDLIKACE
jgi:TRAP-type C4-dicarboxylate transport system substrate-binding protein